MAKRKKKSKQEDIELAELTADELAIIAAGLSLISNIFTIWSLVKVRETAESEENK
ncbi:hypothetical protein [Paenibacillus ihumii]|uniref:hypothetical protein n=1 Tax=Paenibacillus ihumii TaxID=687436 RepID=UPI000AF24AC0|nr:hypothetical protein [Paenibacillus ihumii]